MISMKHHYDGIAGKRVHRIEAISDGVFAVALTLLVLDLKVPVSGAISTEESLYSHLISLTPKLLSYFLSFMTLGIFWTGHSTQFQYIVKSDRHLNWITLFFLMLVSLLPFTTAFLSEFMEFKLAIGLYWLHILALGILIYIHWSYAERHQLLGIPSEDIDSVSWAIKKRVIIAQTLYAIGALACFINTHLSIVIIVLVQLNFAFAPFSKFMHNKFFSTD